MFDIAKNGIFLCDNNDIIKHADDLGVLDYLINFTKKNKIESFLDLGCGNAFYAKKIYEQNIYCEAYDGNPHTIKLSSGFGKILDLSKEFNLQKKFDCVMSLEVGEHIPQQFEEIFINNIINHTKNYIFLSWAVVGQGGDAHVNEKNNDYVINKFDKLGFEYLSDDTRIARESSEKWYFKNTIMIFKKKYNEF